jgi:phosphatidylserine/phosphatidylglycerophosphate/cardiolipin synthase-like enzyme
MTLLTGASAARLADRDYLPYVHARIETAARRIWVAMFIHDVRPSRDVEGSVLDLTKSLVERFLVGVDVRVLLTGQVATPDIAVANLATGLLLEHYGVPHRRVFGAAVPASSDAQGAVGNGRAGSHAKLVICDDVAVLGSQNWTDDAFRLNTEDAVIVAGPGVDAVAEHFLVGWDKGRGLPGNVAG